jgi:hypothetical protein
MASRSADTRERRPRAGAGRLAAAALAVACALAAAAGCDERIAPDGAAYSHQVTIRGRHIPVELALTPAEQARGLSNRDALAPGTGMIFPYARPEIQAFWMAGMRFDIDIVWIRDGRIVDISARLPRPPPEAMSGASPNALPSYRPREPVDLVLEVAAGTAETAGWRIGDAVRVDPPLR